MFHGIMKNSKREVIFIQENNNKEENEYFNVNNSKIFLNLNKKCLH